MLAPPSVLGVNCPPSLIYVKAAVSIILSRFSPSNTAPEASIAVFVIASKLLSTHYLHCPLLAPTL
jgi:hypothetical protein